MGGGGQQIGGYGGGMNALGNYGSGLFTGGTPLQSGNDIGPAFNRMFSGGTPLKQGRDPRWLFPMKKPGVAMDPNTDWYGYPDNPMNASTQFPPPQNFFGQGTKML